MRKRYIYIGLLAGSFLFASCDKYLDIKPVGTVIPTTVEDFRALMTSSYQSFPAHKSYLNLRTDELLLDEYSEDLSSIKDIYLWNDQNQDRTTTSYAYETFYKSIFYANHILAEIDEKAGHSAEADQIKAEAYAMRAYAHFELLNMYAVNYNKTTAATDKGVPLSLTIDLEQKYAPSTVAEVYTQIFSDLDQAEKLFTATTPTTNSLRYRFSKRSFYALKSRIHLYRQEWEQAKNDAEQALILNDKLEDLNDVSSQLPNNYASKEMIQALDEIGVSTVSRSTFIHPDFMALYNAGDLRPAKYFQKSGSRWMSIKSGNKQFNSSFRNAELYLNIAEAEAQLENPAAARIALLKLAKNRLTPAYYLEYETKVNGLSGTALLKEIYLERARELSLEGLRWFDLKRTDRPEITHYFGGAPFVLQSNDVRYVIRYPKEALENNPNL